MKSEILELPSDQYSRNFIISKGICEYKKAKGLGKAKILDVGGRKGRLELFLDPQDELSLLDIRPGKEKNLLTGDATNMREFSDGSFDFVVSGDVFEHIPVSKRKAFIQECLRVSKEMMIIAAPFDMPGVAESEIKANEFFKKVNGINHLWLKEHIDNGLPKKEELERIITENGYKFSIVKSNSLKNWLLLQRCIFFTYGFSIFSNIRHIYRFYNENILKMENEKDDFYRLVYFISKENFPVFLEYAYDEKIFTSFEDKIFNSFVVAKKGNIIAIVKKILVRIKETISR